MPLLRAIALLLLTLGAVHAAAEERLVWQFSGPADADSSSKRKAQLIYGPLEGEAVRLSAECDGSVSGGNAVSRLLFVTDIGTLPAGKEADLRFSGGGFERLAKGRIARQTGDGGAGVALTITIADALWELLAVTEVVDYMVPGYRATPLPLAEGRTQIRAYVDACRTLAAGAPTPPPDQAKAEADVKAAFANAKELGSADAWRAFLVNFPNGFHADLARAYLKRLDPAGATVGDVPLVPEPIDRDRKTGCSTWERHCKAGVTEACEKLKQRCQ